MLNFFGHKEAIFGVLQLLLQSFGKGECFKYMLALFFMSTLEDRIIVLERLHLIKIRQNYHRLRNTKESMLKKFDDYICFPLKSILSVKYVCVSL